MGFLTFPVLILVKYNFQNNYLSFTEQGNPLLLDSACKLDNFTKAGNYRKYLPEIDSKTNEGEIGRKPLHPL
jgi:hypothetical protein